MRSGSPLKGRGVHDGVREGLTSTAFAVFCCCASPFLYSFQFPLPYSSIWCCLCNALFIKSLVRKGFGSEGRNGQKNTTTQATHSEKRKLLLLHHTGRQLCLHRGKRKCYTKFCARSICLCSRSWSCARSWEGLFFFFYSVGKRW